MDFDSLRHLHQHLQRSRLQEQEDYEDLPLQETLKIQGLSNFLSAFRMIIVIWVECNFSLCNG